MDVDQGREKAQGKGEGGGRRGKGKGGEGGEGGGAGVRRTRRGPHRQFMISLVQGTRDTA